MSAAVEAVPQSLAPIASVSAPPMPPPAPAVAPPSPPATSSAPRSPWIVSPWFDLLFFANLTWPLFAVIWAVGLYLAADTQTQHPLNAGISFWFAWLLATPHRWITLGLVYLDRDRFEQRPTAYLGLLAFFFILTVSFVSLELAWVLLLIDWAWNAWHFAAQHSGIGRIYGRVANPADKSSGMFEKVVLRTFAVYVIIRLAGAPVMGLNRERWLGWLDAAMPYFMYIDYPMLLLPAILLGAELPKLSRASMGRFIYLTSICSLYTAVLVGIHLGTSVTFLLQGLLMSIGIVHSTEYLAIVTWSVKKRFAKSKEGVFAYLVPRWGLSLGIFALALGMGAWAINNHFERIWLIVTLVVGYLHYAYDGMIWKVRRPATAAVA